jgi:heme/copper-type cytochrome/quinol oxidase subunit 2
MRDTKKRIARRVLQVLISVFLAVIFIVTLVYFTLGRDIPVLQPAGTIAYQQYILILVSVGLGVFVVLPVFILLFSIAWK